MTKKLLTMEDAKKAIYGGSILGGGGGGLIEEGLAKMEDIFSIGHPTLATVDEFSPNDYVACVSLVGAPSAEDMYIDAEQMIKTVKRMQEEFPHPIVALMTNENGAATSINGWLQSAATGLPFLDAPANGRAHPTGTMGALNLTEVPHYQSLQTFAGGKGDRSVEGVITASLDNASSAIRSISVQAGGMVGVCRNPVTIDYIKENAAIGGISQAIALGELYLNVNKGYERIEAVTAYLKGDILHSGKVKEFSLNKTGGFDVGLVQIDDLELTFWNEYMTAEVKGERLATFPSLIMTFDQHTGEPVVSAHIKKGMDITVIAVPQEQLLLSSTMYNKKLLKAVEPIIDKTIL